MKWVPGYGTYAEDLEKQVYCYIVCSRPLFAVCCPHTQMLKTHICVPKGQVSQFRISPLLVRVSKHGSEGEDLSCRPSVDN